MRRLTTTCTAAGAAVALVLTGISGAVAADRPSDANQTADLISTVAPDQGAVVKAKSGSDTVSAQVGDIRTAVPLDPAGAVTVTSTDQDAGEAGAASLQVHLPAQVDVGQGQVADDGTVVYPSKTTNGADAAVQTLDDGSVRIQTVTKDASGPTRFGYEFGGDVTPVVNDDGSVDLVREISDGVAVQVGHVDPAWAKDADGVSLPTRYAVQGDTLTQSVTTTAATIYPVVADPKVSIGIVTGTVYFNKKETKDASSYGTAAGFCGWVSRIPEAGWILAAACASYVGAVVIQANRAKNRGMCLKIKFNTFPSVGTVWWPDIYKGGNCK